MPVLAHPSLGHVILVASILGVTGIAILIVGYYIWELVTPYNLRRELQENKNVAVAVVAAAFILGMAVVIAAALVHIG